MAADPLTVTPRIAIWPWLTKGVKIAFDPRKLILAALGIGLTGIGWFLIDSGLAPKVPPRVAQDSGAPTWLMPESESASGQIAGTIFPNTGLGGPGAKRSTGDLMALETSRVFLPVRVFVMPWLSLFQTEITWVQFAHASLAGLWTTIVWGIFGGAIARIAVVEVATIEQSGLISSLKFAIRRAYALIAAPLAPLLIVGMFAIPGIILGAISRLGAFGETIAGSLGFIPLLAAVPITIVLLALATTWPLMHLTVVAEGEDVFDALSRSFSYLSQRTGRYVILILLAGAFGLVGESLLTLIAYLVMNLAAWTVSLSARPGDAAIALGANGPILALWVKLIDLTVLAWSFSYLWSASAVIYLILRNEVDGTPTHDIYFPSHEADTFAGEPVAAVSE